MKAVAETGVQLLINGRLRPHALTGQVGTRSNRSGNATYQASTDPPRCLLHQSS